MFYEGLSLQSIFLYVVVPFLPNCSCHVFLFNCPISNYLAQHSNLHLRQKRSHSFYSKGFWSATSHYSSPRVSAGCCYVYKSQIYCISQGINSKNGSSKLLYILKHYYHHQVVPTAQTEFSDSLSCPPSLSYITPSKFS